MTGNNLSRLSSGFGSIDLTVHNPAVIMLFKSREPLVHFFPHLAPPHGLKDDLITGYFSLRRDDEFEINPQSSGCGKFGTIEQTP